MVLRKAIRMWVASVVFCLAVVSCLVASAQQCKPDADTGSLPEVPQDEDEFYVHIDKIVSPTELEVTVLDIWVFADKLHGYRWPNGKPKVKPVPRTILLEEISVPDGPENKKAAIEFLEKVLKQQGREAVCSGSSVSVRKGPGGEVICITGCVFAKAGFTLNNALVRNGFATTSNPLYQSWQEEAKRKKLGIWRDAK